jgi:hypothetical protein
LGETGKTKKNENGKKSHSNLLSKIIPIRHGMDLKDLKQFLRD